MEGLDSGEKDFSYIRLKTERRDGKPDVTWADLRSRNLNGSSLDFSDMRMARVGKATRVHGASMMWVDARGVEGMESMDGVESMKFYRMLVTERQRNLINDAILKGSGVTYGLSELEEARRDTPGRTRTGSLSGLSPRRTFRLRERPPRKERLPVKG